MGYGDTGPHLRRMKVQGHPLLHKEHCQPRLPGSPSEKEYYFDKNILTHRDFLRNIHHETGRWGITGLLYQDWEFYSERDTRVTQRIMLPSWLPYWVYERDKYMGQKGLVRSLCHQFRWEMMGPVSEEQPWRKHQDHETYMARVVARVQTGGAGKSHSEDKT